MNWPSKEAMEAMSDADVRAAVVENQAWIDGSENDGRLTPGSSATLDMCQGVVEEGNAILKQRAEVSQHE